MVNGANYMVDVHFNTCNAKFLDSGQYRDRQFQANMITLVVRKLGTFLLRAV
jgi:hypothetical protein